MKKITKLLALFFSLISHVTVSQINSTRLLENQEITLREVESFLEEHSIVPLPCVSNSQEKITLEAYNARDSSFKEDEAIVVNVYFHILRNEDKQYKFNVKEEDVLEAVALLNNTFNEHRIYFKFQGFNYLNNNKFLKVYLGGKNTFQQLVDYSKNQNVFKFTSLNIFVVKEVMLHPKDTQKLSGAATRVGITSLIDDDYLLTSSLIHEIGHNFSLEHTHHNWNTSICETSLRNDGIEDTPPSVPFTKEEVGTDCVSYKGKRTNNKCGIDLKKVPANNFMSSNTLPCRSLNNAYFTKGQVQRMKHMLRSSAVLRNTHNSIESLYYPYKGSYDQDFLGTTIANKASNVSFQKGFNYEFVMCNNVKKIQNIYSKYETPTTHPFYTAIRIREIMPSEIKNCNIPKKSTYKNGMIATFENSFSGNLKIKELSSEEIQKEGVINYLPNGLNIIKLQNSTGKITRKKIYKK